MRFVLGVEDLKHPVRRSPRGQRHLVQLVQLADRIVKERQEQEELHEVPELHRSLHDRRSAESQDEDVADHPDEGHPGRVEGPPLEDQGR